MQTATKKKDFPVKVHCIMCKEEHTICVNKEDWDLYNSPNRPHIQDIFPYLSPADRELFITGICDDCWKKTFGGDEDE